MLHCGTKLLTKSRLHTKNDKKHDNICHVSGEIAIFTAAVETSHIKPLFKNEKTNHHPACRHRDSGGGGRTGQARRIVRDAARRHRNARSAHGRRIPPHLSHRRLSPPHHRRRRIHAICPLRRQRRAPAGVRRARIDRRTPPLCRRTRSHSHSHSTRHTRRHAFSQKGSPAPQSHRAGRSRTVRFEFSCERRRQSPCDTGKLQGCEIPDAQPFRLLQRHAHEAGLQRIRSHRLGLRLLFRQLRRPVPSAVRLLRPRRPPQQPQLLRRQ